MNIRLLRSCSVPLWISSPKLNVRGTNFLHEVYNMERYLTTTYRLHELHICAWDWYVTITYHLCTNDEKNVKYLYEVFSHEFLVCWWRAWYVLRVKGQLSTSFAEVLRQLAKKQLVKPKNTSFTWCSTYSASNLKNSNQGERRKLKLCM